MVTRKPGSGQNPSVIEAHVTAHCEHLSTARKDIAASLTTLSERVQAACGGESVTSVTFSQYFI